jgi:hypothetical protein
VNGPRYRSFENVTVRKSCGPQVYLPPEASANIEAKYLSVVTIAAFDVTI